MAQHVYGVDLGTSNIKMYSSASDNILNEKNVIAIKNKNDIFSYGNQAFEMYEKAPANIAVSFPVKYGVIADIKNMETLFNCFFKKLNGGKNVTGADYCIAVPTDVTEVEKRAFYDVILDAKLKAKNITVVEKPIADAVGMGIDVESPNGHMIVDIGADTTEISVISLGGIVLSKLIKTGGTKFDEAICGIVRKKYNLVIGSRSAEQIKIQLADAVEPSEDISGMTYGRNILTGLPNAREISASLIHEAINELLHQIIENIKLILERTPPELTADIYAKGIYLTGGSAQIMNIDKLITEETGLKVNMAENPSETVIRGIASIVTTPELMGLTYVPREKQYN
ncbi:MAG: rod shape-determining protein [Lachnospiraceae bacterium]|nr:rod shape-determining protein [Lachnospiraceae bacterium]